MRSREIQLIKGKDKIAFILFALGVLLELTVMMTDNMASWTLPYRGRVTQVAFALFVIKMLFTRYDLTRVIFIGIAGIIGVISYVTCREEYVIRTVVFVAAAAGIETDRILKIIFWAILISTLLIVTGALIGFGGQITDVRDYGRGVIETRYCLGFNHANNIHSIFWYLTSLLLLIYREKLRLTHYVIICIANAALYYFTLSRTGLMSTLLVLILAVVAVYVRSKAVDVLYLLGVIAAVIVSIAITVRSAVSFPYKSDLMIKIDRILTGRVEMVWEHAPMSMWRIFPDGQVAELVDNGFAVILYDYGYVVAGLLVISIIVAAVKLYKDHGRHAQIVLITSVMLLFMEATFMINVSLLCNMLLIVYMWTINTGDTRALDKKDADTVTD